MTDNSKGELIKKKTTPQPQPQPQQKKKLVIKKVKKVVIKKSPEEQKPKEIHKKPQQERNFTPKRNQSDNNSQQDQKKKIVYKKNNFQNQERPNDKRPFRGPNIATEAPAPGAPAADRDKAKRKQNKKQEIFDRIESKKEDFQKAFIQRRHKHENKLSSVPEQIDISDVISISDLAKKMNLKANVLISKLMELGTMVTINDTIDSDTAEIVCSEFKCKVNVVSLYDQTVIEEENINEDDLESRPPIVTVMGHVDHGKTKLLDAIKSTNVVAGESGGITQHIGAYKVTLENGHSITFIDTPGHEAFTTMRARGANVTDIIILVVAADDGVMPQTIEAINHAKAANVPIIVAINKVDKEGSNIDKVKQQLTDYDLLPEEWGGQTLYSEISALKKLGIKELLDNVILQSEMLDLKTSYKVRATGFVLESKIEPGRGVVPTVLVSKGVLKVGDFFVAGVYYGKIRALYSDTGEKIKQAGPSTPVEVLGIEKSPNAGDPFNVTATEKEAKIFSSKRQELKRMEEASSVKKVTLKDFLAQKPEGEVQELKVVIKADVQGSVEALKDSLEKLSNQEIKIITVSAGVGAINESDVMLAVASNAIIIGFHVRPNNKAADLADREKIEIKRYNIIYDVIEDVKAAMSGMIRPDLIEEYLGEIEIKQVFKISKIGTVAGCIVTKGKVKRNALIRLMRDNVLIHTGKISTLKRFKDDANEVLEGTECGIGLENYKDIKEGDLMEAYQLKEIARTYDDIKDKA